MSDRGGQRPDRHDSRQVSKIRLSLEQLLVDRCQLPGALRDAQLEFLGGPPLFVQEPSLLQREDRLIHGDLQQERLNCSRKIGALRAGDEYPPFVSKSELEERNRDLSRSNRIRDHEM